MLIKTILNNVAPLKHFVYHNVQLIKDSNGKPKEIRALIHPRSNSQAICSSCEKPAPGYDVRMPYREFQFVPLWNIPVKFIYAMRRVNCKNCGVKTEKIPWAKGKSNICKDFKIFLAAWAKRLSWKETAKIFNVSWAIVALAVQHVVEYGLKNRDVSNVQAIGVDEVKWKVGYKYLTLVYQIDKGMRRLLYVGKDRTVRSILRFFMRHGKSNCENIRIVCTDMWKPYLKVIRKKIPNALNILDRFHIRKHLNEAIDKTRRQESAELKKENENHILIKSRWALLKNEENLKPSQVQKMKELLKSNTRTIRAYLYGKEFGKFWKYKYGASAMKFLSEWNAQVMKSKIEPLKKFVEMMRRHEDLIKNWFKVRGEFSSGPVEGLNCKIKVTMRKAYGYKDFKTAETALFHQLGHLPEPPSTHRFV